MAVSIIDTTTFQNLLQHILHFPTTATNLTLGVTLATAWFQSDVISNLHNCIVYFLVPNRRFTQLYLPTWYYNDTTMYIILKIPSIHSSVSQLFSLATNNPHFGVHKI